MLYEIKRWDNGEIIFSHECDSWKICVEAAVAAKKDLYRASLVGASLYGASLVGARLDGASLVDARLDGARLVGASLYRASLVGASLYRASLVGASLVGASLKDIKNAAISLAQTRIVPQEGAFVGWKKLQNGIIAKLVIPHDAERVNAAGSRKCRASKVFVHEMYDAAGAVFTGIGIGNHDVKTRYETGKETFPDKFDPSITEECSHGIHFFLTREEAEAY